MERRKYLWYIIILSLSEIESSPTVAPCDSNVAHCYVVPSHPDDISEYPTNQNQIMLLEPSRLVSLVNFTNFCC